MLASFPYPPPTSQYGQTGGDTCGKGHYFEWATAGAGAAAVSEIAGGAY